MKHRTATSMVGTANPLAYQSTSHPTMIASNHAVPMSVAIAPRAEMEARLRCFLADFAQHCITKIPLESRVSVTPWLQDMKRGRNVRFVEQLADCLSLDPLAFSEGVHGEAVRLLPTTAEGPCDALNAETRAQAEADVAQTAFIVERTPTRRDAAIAASLRHLAKLRTWLDVMHRWPSRGTA